MAFNIAVVVWLVASKRLFGVRGGHRAYVAARRGQAVLDPADFTTPGPDATSDAQPAPGEGAAPADAAPSPPRGASARSDAPPSTALRPADRGPG